MSQSEQLTLHQQEADSIHQTAEETIKELQEQLCAQADLHKAAEALAKAELDRLRKVFNTESAEMLDSQAAKLKAEHDEVLAERDFAFDNAQAAIASQNDEIEELQNTIQEEINKNFTLQQAIKGRENFRIYDDDSVGLEPPKGTELNREPPKGTELNREPLKGTELIPQQATSSTSPVFYPFVSSNLNEDLPNSPETYEKKVQGGTFFTDVSPSVGNDQRTWFDRAFIAQDGPHLGGLSAFWGLQDGPRQAQDGPRWPQDGSLISWTRHGPIHEMPGSQDWPKMASKKPKMSQDWAKISQDWPKMGPRWAKMGQDEPDIDAFRRTTCPPSSIRP